MADKWSFTKKRLGDILIDAGLITRKQLDDVLEIQRSSGGKLGEILIEKNIIKRSSIYKALELQLGIPYINLNSYNISPEVVKIVPESMARKYEILPIKLEGNLLTVATADPLNASSFDDIRIYSGYDIQPVIVDSEIINKNITRYFSSQKAIEAVEQFTNLNQLAIEEDATAAELGASEEIRGSPAVKFLHILIQQAVQNHASDIHIEPQQKKVHIRYRIDGQLVDMIQSKTDIMPSIISRIKVIAGLDIAEKRLPQDGRITYNIGNKEIELRVSVIPAINGEKIVFRVISKDTFNIPKEQLGFSPDNLKAFQNMLRSPHGIILVTGPTGSGKTTTLYAAIKELNKPNVNIVTVEDPVESTIEGITQIQVNPKAGLKFANSLRSILRQDPDIILIGEIRDTETAQIAIRAAMTGHLVLSTLHTNDAASSVVRLFDMEIKPFLVSSSLVGVIAQRLVRRICKECRESYVPTYEEAQQMDINMEDRPVIYRGKGCDECNGTGYKGRIAVYEVMNVDADIREAIYQGLSIDIIKGIAIKNGMSTLKENYIKLVLDGVTTYKEMIRVVYLQE